MKYLEDFENEYFITVIRAKKLAPARRGAELSRAARDFKENFVRILLICIIIIYSI